MRPPQSYLPLLLLALVACGDDGGQASPDANPQPDADTNTTDAGSSGAQIVTVGGDYAGTGVLTTIDLPSFDVTVNAVAGVVGGDPALKASGDHLIILNRLGGDSITVLDRELTLVGQASTGTGSNPQDAVIVGDWLYVVAYDATGVLVFDISDLEAGVQNTIELSELDADDDVPDCNSITYEGGRLFVSCQVLNRETFSARGNGKVAVIDEGTNTLSSVVTLQSENPVAWLEATANGVYLATGPYYLGGSGEDGCIERVSTGESPAAECVVEYSAIGDFVSDVLWHNGGLHFVNGVGFTMGSVMTVEGNTPVSLPLSEVGTAVTAIEGCPTGELVVADHTDGARGIRVYAQDGTALTSGPIDVGWPSVFLPANATVCW